MTAAELSATPEGSWLMVRVRGSWSPRMVESLPEGADRVDREPLGTALERVFRINDHEFVVLSPKSFRGRPSLNDVTAPTAASVALWEAREVAAGEARVRRARETARLALAPR